LIKYIIIKVKIKDKNQKTNKNQNSPPIKIQYLQSAKIQIFYIITLKKEIKELKVFNNPKLLKISEGLTPI